jgi:hypothetical protein
VRDLTMYPQWKLPKAHRLGFGASNSKVHWKAMSIRALPGGTVRPLKPPVDEPPDGNLVRR